MRCIRCKDHQVPHARLCESCASELRTQARFDGARVKAALAARLAAEGS